MHTPVLFDQVMAALDVQPSGRYIDATLGEGGFTQAIADRGGTVLSIDWDEDQVEQARTMFRTYQNVQLVHGNFAQIQEIAKEKKVIPVDGILIDLGLSMKQLAESGRGFSYKNHSEPLDMRIHRGTTPVSENINSYTFEELYEIVSGYSEELYSRSVVQAICRARSVKPVNTVGDLVTILDTVAESKGLVRTIDRERLYARIFQAFRIDTNGEFDNLRKVLMGSEEILSSSGLIVIITFHSREDRIVKLFARQNNLKMRVIQPGKDSRPFERSAKVRVLSTS